MANKLFPKWKQAILQVQSSAALNGSGTTGVYAAMIDLADYTYSDAHEFYSSIEAAIVGNPVEINNKTFVNGLFDGDDVAFTAVTGDSIEALILYVRNAGANTTWRLVAFLDTGFTGLPVTPNGGALGCAWNASGIFQL